jgi:broad specificity phosphatase PhoE
LTSQGLLQARSIAESLASEGILTIYSSPRRRALRTAQVIAERLGLTPIVMDGLAEADFGEWEGLTFREVSRRDPGLLERWLADPIHTRPPGGENLAEMWERVRRCLDEVVLALQVRGVAGPGSLAAAGGGAIALVSHGGPIRAVLSFHRQGDLSAFRDVLVRPGEVRLSASARANWLL